MEQGNYICLFFLRCSSLSRCLHHWRSQICNECIELQHKCPHKARAAWMTRHLFNWTSKFSKKKSEIKLNNQMKNGSEAQSKSEKRGSIFFRFRSFMPHFRSLALRARFSLSHASRSLSKERGTAHSLWFHKSIKSVNFMILLFHFYCLRYKIH